jgi:hypothetical protein
MRLASLPDNVFEALANPKIRLRWPSWQVWEPLGRDSRPLWIWGVEPQSGSEHELMTLSLRRSRPNLSQTIRRTKLEPIPSLMLIGTSS